MLKGKLFKLSPSEEKEEGKDLLVVTLIDNPTNTRTRMNFLVRDSLCIYLSFKEPNKHRVMFSNQWFFTFHGNNKEFLSWFQEL